MTSFLMLVMLLGTCYTAIPDSFLGKINICFTNSQNYNIIIILSRTELKVLENIIRVKEESIWPLIQVKNV